MENTTAKFHVLLQMRFSSPQLSAEYLLLHMTFPCLSVVEVVSQTADVHYAGSLVSSYFFEGRIFLTVAWTEVVNHIKVFSD